MALTGATGFIGRNVAAALRASGYGVRAFVRPDSRNLQHLDAAADRRLLALTDVRALAGALEDVDAVVYAAGTVRGRGPSDFEAANVHGVAALASAIVGLARPVPVLLLSSLAATRPSVSAYAESKSRGEQVLVDSGVRWTILRPPPVYGPGDREMLPLFQWMRRGVALEIGPPGQRLSLLHVADLARAVVAWLDHTEACSGGVFSIDDGRDRGYDWPAMHAAVRAGRSLRVRIPRAVFEAVAAVNQRAAATLGYAPMLTPGKVRELWQEHWCCDNKPFVDRTGWQPQIQLRHGADRLFKKHGDSDFRN